MVSTPKFVAFVLGFLLVASLILFDQDGYVSVIDDANLLFHEAGHLIFGFLGNTMGLYGGKWGNS